MIFIVSLKKIKKQQKLKINFLLESIISLTIMLDTFIAHSFATTTILFDSTDFLIPVLALAANRGYNGKIKALKNYPMM